MGDVYAELFYMLTVVPPEDNVTDFLGYYFLSVMP
jgi:hypothetical protein